MCILQGAYAKDGRRCHPTIEESNNAHAIYILAIYYRDGDKGYLRDSNKAVELFLKAGKLGCADAYYTLGNIYNDGEIVGKDLKKAKQYFELGAIEGCVWSRHNLGCLELDAGNNERAVKHFVICAKAGHASALKAVTFVSKLALLQKMHMPKRFEHVRKTWRKQRVQ